MAIVFHDARMLWEARLNGVSFRNTLTVGHLRLCLHPAEIKYFCNAYQDKYSKSEIKPFEGHTFGDHSDSFLRDFLGAESLSILDYSAYQGANIVHDLNRPIPEDFQGQFDAVIDSGSLEHIFHFPTAIINLMKIVKIGGSIFITTPANNLCGHGFYQFSPELMFRIFTKENGFELKRIALFEAAYPSIELTPVKKAYEVTDPEDVHMRVMLISKGPVMMMVEAKKSDDVALFATFPLQSDYKAKWAQSDTELQPKDLVKRSSNLLEKLPFFLRTRIVGYLQKKRSSFANNRFYKKF